MQRGEFREDLYYRLNVLTITIPPLRKRPQDIMPLTELFGARADEQGGRGPRWRATGGFLSKGGWPGNAPVENAIYRALTWERLNCGRRYRVAGVRGWRCRWATRCWTARWTTSASVSSARC
ncbi:hypothetical protein M8494_09195 [Serratia ureilytica]